MSNTWCSFHCGDAISVLSVNKERGGKKSIMMVNEYNPVVIQILLNCVLFIVVEL